MSDKTQDAMVTALDISQKRFQTCAKSYEQPTVSALFLGALLFLDISQKRFQTRAKSYEPGTSLSKVDMTHR